MIHRANHNSPRLKPILDALIKAGPRGVTSLELSMIGKTVAVGTSVSELRHSGFDITCEYQGRTETGRKFYRYFLTYDPAYEAIDNAGAL